MMDQSIWLGIIKRIRGIFFLSTGRNIDSSTLLHSHDTITKTAFLPYENLSRASMGNKVAAAEDRIKNGWRVKNYPIIPLYPPQIPWEDSVAISRSWSFHIHSWDMLDDVLTAYSITKNEKYLDVALQISLEWISKFVDKAEKSVFAWYDMAVGVRAYRLAYILDATLRQKNSSQNDIEQLYKALILHKNNLDQDINIAYQSNHGFFQLAGQLALTNRFIFLPGMKTANEQALVRFLKILKTQFSPEGVHLEHSPDYHRMVYVSLRELVNSGIRLNKEIEENLVKIDENFHWFIKPDGNLVNFGDTDQKQIIRPKDSPQKWLSPEMQFIASDGKYGKASTETVKTFKESGYFIARKNWPSFDDRTSKTYLAQIACFHSRTHKHADDLSFIWFDQGVDILVDSGRYGYQGKTTIGSKLWREGYYYDDPKRIYVESTRAHNTIEVDGKNFERMNRKPYGSAIRTTGEISGIAFCETDVIQFKTLDHRRILFLNPEKWLLVIDRLLNINESMHEFKQWFHFSPNLRVTKKPDHYQVEDQNFTTPLLVFPLIENTEMSDVLCGVSEPALQGWWSPEEKIFEPNTAISFEKRNIRNATFATLFAFSKEIKTDFNSSTIDDSGKSGHFQWEDANSQKGIEFSFENEDSPILDFHEE